MLPTFEVRFVGPGLAPERIPLRAVSDALSAVQDLASGRDPYETPHVPLDKGIGLVKVRRGSAVYSCVSRAPDEAISNLSHVGLLLSSTGDHGGEEDGLVAALRPVESLSDVARSIGSRVEVSLVNHDGPPLFVIDKDAFQRISSRLLMHGDTTVIGRVERVGGATNMRCMMRVPGRRRALHCDVKGNDLVRRLGQHLYEQIVATGTATWIHRSWRIYRFKIRDFTQPKLGDPIEAIERLRNAGLKAWDHIPDPDALFQELRQ
ncbi:MAG: hypothetical protein KKE86_06795 [Planctomycetes bacterium]|nr:hypothetical protein [Planctomycetota bacterium]MBU4399029.1 hypothetical protein [Planctomycetota bacterium]MCG2682999.1 hypothetical protein [Planctomycetales bacterium]